MNTSPAFYLLHQFDMRFIHTQIKSDWWGRSICDAQDSATLAPKSCARDIHVDWRTKPTQLSYWDTYIGKFGLVNTNPLSDDMVDTRKWRSANSHGKENGAECESPYRGSFQANHVSILVFSRLPFYLIILASLFSKGEQTRQLVTS